MPVKYALLVISMAAVLTDFSCRQQDVSSQLHSARNAIIQNNPEDALIHLKYALKKLQDDTSQQAVEQRTTVLLMTANLHAFQLGNPQRAMKVYRQLISSNPEAPEALEGRLHLADLLRYHANDLHGAITELTAARTKNPALAAKLSYQVAELYFELEDYNQCILEAATLAEKYTPSHWVAKALFLRAEALSMMKERHAEAKHAFLEVITRFPNSKLKSDAMYELGRLTAETGALELAIKLWVEALREHPTPSVVQHAIARARARLYSNAADKKSDVLKAPRKKKSGRRRQLN